MPHKGQDDHDCLMHVSQILSGEGRRERRSSGQGRHCPYVVVPHLRTAEQGFRGESNAWLIPLLLHDPAHLL
jgi:hypothetical protein